LFTITRNEVYAALRQIARFSKQDSIAEKDMLLLKNETDELVLQHDYERIVRMAVDRLPAQQKRAYLLSNEDGLKRSEVAAIMQISPETVKSYLRDANRNIRAFCLSMIRFGLLISLSDAVFW
ncbi:MAG: hypothetical protein J7497_16440, partial [Chitinophagaceae bacterium]|nr:hypothetical protein [Chitinophagaceae bacterium]